MGYRLVAPVIRWGTNYNQAWYLPSPLDNVECGSEPRQGSEFVQAPSGVEDAWIVGTDYVLTGDLRWIPQSDSLYYPRATGWDTAAGGLNGARAALEWLRRKNSFAWHPDGRNLLRRPLVNNAGDVMLSGFGGWGTEIGSVTGGSVTFDAGEGAWKATATGGGGGSPYLGLYQYVPSIAGESVVLSVDYKTSGLVNTAEGRIFVDSFDATPTYLSTPYGLAGLTSAVYARANAGGTFSVAMGAGTAYMRIELRLYLPLAGSAGTIWFKNAMVRRDSSNTTFIDNPAIENCYLVDPMQGAPASESDGSRKIAGFKIRNASVSFDGY